MSAKPNFRPKRSLLLILTLFVVGLVGAGGVWWWQNRDRAEPGEGGLVVRVETGGAATEAVLTGGGDSNAQLVLTLSAGQPEPKTAARIALAQGTPLSEAEIEAILARLPELLPEDGDVVEFSLPTETLPPPQTGDRVDQPFPPPEAPPEVAEVPSGPLEVLRFSPEGPIPLAPFLSVTFNQPMVPLATVEMLSAAEVPVQLTPEIPGIWRWLGTQTLTFEYEGDEDFPKATEFVAEVPAGTLSATGNALAETVSWTFTTPAAQVTRFYPSGGPQKLDPLFFVAFNQQIDPAAVLATINMADTSLRLATAEEIAADETVALRAEAARDGTWLAFRPAERLAPDTTYNIAIGPGTPSAEGPLLTEEAYTNSITTYGPLEIVRAECGYYADECPPLAPLQITFSNPLDTAVFTDTMIGIEPDLPGAIVEIFGNTLSIRGATVGQTTYNVFLSADIQDIFGQTLGDDETRNFRVGSAAPGLFGPDQPFVTLDPSLQRPVLSVFAINYSELEIQAYRVTPADWGAYLVYQDEYRYQENPPSPPGERVLNTTLELDTPDDVLTEVPIELADALEGSTGHLLLIIKPPAREIPDRYSESSQTKVVWLQVTQIGLDAVADGERLIAWATDLATGAPLSGVQLALGNSSATTAADGLAELDARQSGVLVATLGEDIAILPRSYYRWDEESWAVYEGQDELRWYVTDDRRLYQPGETVHAKGWLRLIGQQLGGDVGLVDGLQGVNFEVFDPQGNMLTSGTAPASSLGGFDLSFELPDNANLGDAYIQITATGAIPGEGRTYYHYFQIQEFRRPEFEVTARNETTGPYFVGGSATVATTAEYFAGGPLPNAEVNWLVQASPSSYQPPNWPGFVFGSWTPWWYYDYFYYEAAYEEAYYGGPFVEESRVQTFSGVTDANGTHYLQIDFEAMSRPQPFSVMAEATVFDVNRQAWTGATSLLVHPADLYVGLHSDQTFVKKGTPLEIQTIVTDLDGNAVAGRPIEIRAARLEWRYRQGSWGEVEADVQLCTVTSTTEPVLCTFETPNGGEYRITATIQDESGRENMSEFTRWVSGGNRPVSRDIEQEQLLLIPDKEEYQPGDTAQILVQAPFYPAEGLLTVSRSGILYTERFQIGEDGTATLSIPIAAEHIPNLELQVDLVGSTARTDDEGQPRPDLPARPAYASGNLSLRIPPLSRTLTISASPQASALAPGESTAVDVTVLDANGQPVPDAELLLVVVDEAILGLSNYQLLDPINIFYPNRWGGTQTVYGRQSIILANPESLAVSADGANSVVTTRVVTEVEEVSVEAMGGEMVMEEAEMAFDADTADTAGAAPSANDGAAPPIAVRTDFNPLATFAPAVRTDASGQATVEVSLPDNLTRYRIMVVAVAGGQQYGTAEANLTARLPLMVRPSAPRFLNFGDQVEFPVVLQNQTDAPLVVDVVLETTNLEMMGPAGFRVDVPANNRVEVRFPATTVGVGTARYQVAAVSGDYADAASGSLPVYTPATTEAFATYGVLDGGAVAQPLAYPEGVYPQFGGLEISTSSTALQALTDAVLYLSSYRYEGSEQLASRILGIAALRDVLDAFEAEGLPSPAELEAAVARDIETLAGMQNFDGGWPVWERNRESYPFHTVHVVYALQMAQLKGYEVPDDTLLRGMDYLRVIEEYYPAYYSPYIRHTLSAYALFVLHELGDSDPTKAAALFAESGLDGMSMEGLAWIWPVLAEGGYNAEATAIADHFANRVVETAAAANFTTSYGDDAYLLLHSNRRTDAVILNALISQTPNSDLIPKVVTGLLAHQTRGRWLNTQENVFVLLALDRYFNTFEATEPEFVANLWLGESYAGRYVFVGRSTETQQSFIPMDYLLATLAEPGTTEDLIFGMEGVGRLYYRLGLSYAPDDLDLDPLDMGFTVQRSYEAVDDPEDVWQDEDGVWHVRAGARVLVRVAMATNNRRYHVALVDPLAAGLEIINPALANSQSPPPDALSPDSRESWWWWGPWYEHQNLRDEQAEAFATLLWEGSYTYSYIARATTPGTYIVPPAHAEELYFPETFGRSGTDVLVVED